MDIRIDVSNTVLETPRLVLRPWRESDVADLYSYASVEGVGEMAGWKHHESLEESREILARFIDHRNVFALEHRGVSRIIGSLGLHRSWANEEAGLQKLKVKELGYVLSREYWGQGLMPEALCMVIEFCFEECGLDAVTAGHFTGNNQSRSVLEKCGFQFVKQSRYHAEELDKTFDEMQYILYQ